MVLRPGDRVGEWTIEKQLGSGGMGTVFLAQDSNTTKVAVKELRAEGVPDAVRRFAREAKILAELDHPGIIRFLGFTEDPTCLIMEFAKGEPLDIWVQRGPMPTHLALGMTRQVSEALAYIHGRGIFHRDIKPQNIMVENNGTSKLVDFGVAIANDRTRYTQAGSLLGTLPYVPPEALAGQEPDPVKWDVYALGVVLFEVLTGKLAFRGGDGSRTGFEARLIHEKMNLKSLDPGPLVPDQVRTLVRQMTDADPNKRLSNPSEVSRKIQMLLQAAEQATGSVPIPAKKSSSALWLLLGAGGLGLVAFLGIGIAGYFALKNGDVHPETPTPPPVETPAEVKPPEPPPAPPPPSETPPTPPTPPAETPPAETTTAAMTPEEEAAAQLASLRAEVKSSQKRLSGTLAPLKIRFVEQTGPQWDIVVDGTTENWNSASESIELTVSAVMAAIGTESASTHWKSRNLVLKVDGNTTTTIPVSDARNFVKTGFSAEQRAAMQQALKQ